MRTNEGRMPALRVSVSIWILAIACVGTVKNVATINVELENGDIPHVANVTSRLWKRHNGAGIFNDHIKRWNYFKDTRKIWLWPKGVIPYVIGTGFTSPERTLIWETMQQFGKNTCIKFQSRQKERDYIEFKKSDKGCLVFIGRLKGRNLVELDSGCLKRRTDLMHQMMHVMGFYDQHNAPDRDKWITIGWENIRSDKKSYFEISKARMMDAQQPYDFNSLMHLGANAFSKDSYHHTMWPLLRVQQIGPLSDKMNSHDIYKINKLYVEECKERMTAENKGNTRTGNGQNDGNDKKPSENGNGKENDKNGKDKPNSNGNGKEKPNNNGKDKPNSNGNGKEKPNNNGKDDKPASNGNGKPNNGKDKKPNQNGGRPGKKPDGKKDQLTPHMICVFWPVTIGNSTASKKVIKQRDTLDALTDSQKIHVFNNHETYRRKCPPKNRDPTTT